MSEADYPTLGFDPAPGAPASVADLASKLSAAVTGLAHANATLTSIAKGGDACVWEGETATAFSRKVGDLPRYLTDSHDALKSAAADLTTWHAKLVEYQTTARRYESEAKAAKGRVTTAGAAHDHSVSAYNQAASDPASQLVGQRFASEAAARAAQARIDAAGVRLRHADHALDTATKRLDAARDELDAIVKKAKDLLDHHQSEARSIAAQLRKADGNAPDPSFWAKLGDLTKKAGHSIKDWCTEHADLLKTIGDWMGTASAVLGVAALATMWCPPLAGGLALAGGIAAGGALAAHGAAKLGDADVGWKTLAGDAVGVIPGGVFAKDIALGVKVPIKLAEKSGNLLKGGNIVRKIEESNEAFRGSQATPNLFSRAMGATDAIKFARDGFKFGDKVNLAWQHSVASYSEGGFLADRVSNVFTKAPLQKIPSVAAAIRSDGTLDPMSWWSRGTQIGQKAWGLRGRLEEDFGPGAPTAGSLG
ncbi:putative T7SS-secreted protein [Streptomyces sp. DW26H14]|uniref:putative T7SS-secreted protein n=1 Tax=Streptomyces sp. DW26H14 TaxID=3435395 RepID=UPI00403D974F